MEKLPIDLHRKILCLLDHHNLAAAQQESRMRKNMTEMGDDYDLPVFGVTDQVCRKWRLIASENDLWSNLYIERWGNDSASFYAPLDSKPWKEVYAVQDRCDRVGLGLKIIREGEDYYLVHQGEIQRHLGSKKPQMEPSDSPISAQTEFAKGESADHEEPCLGILDKILFFLGDLESASSSAKRSRVY